MDGSVGPAARAAEKFARHLRQTSGLAVELYDERLSTFEAKQRLRNEILAPKPLRKADRDGAVDAIAAVVILESWLSSRARPEA